MPEYWGRDSPYHGGTDFLGTPANHMEASNPRINSQPLTVLQQVRAAASPAVQLVAKRPLAPDVFEIDGRQPHYKFPAAAISSITNRVTGCLLSVGGCPSACKGACSMAAASQACETCVFSCCNVAADSAGSGAIAYIALTGDVGAAIATVKDVTPLLVLPAKAAVAFPLVRRFR